MDPSLESALKDIGWSSGFHLPVANAENKALENEMADLVLKKSRMIKQFDETNEKFKNFENHLKYVRAESLQNQNLLQSYHQQVDNENHKFQLASSEKNSLNCDLKTIAKNLADVENRQAIKRKDLQRNLSKLETMKTEASWDAEALKAWEDSLKKRDEDNEMLKKFSEEDRRKAIDLEAKRQNLQIEVTNKLNMLDKMNVDITNSEHTMLRIGKILKQMNDERNALVRQWQESVKNLRQRDADGNRLTKQMDNMRDLINQKTEALQEAMEFLNTEINNNKALELEIDENNVVNSRMRKELSDLAEENATFNSELASRKKMTEATANDLRKEQMQTKNIIEETNRKGKQITQLKGEIEKLSIRHEEVKAKTMTTAERIKEIEDMLEQADHLDMGYKLEQDFLEDFLYKKQQKLMDARELEKKKHSELLCAEGTLGSIRKRFKQAKQNLIHQKQVLSDMEMKVACLEAKLGNLEGEVSMEEDLANWSHRIKVLEASFAEENEIKILLHSQILKLQKETLRLVSIISNDTERLQREKDKLQALVLMIEGGIKMVATAKLRMQQKQVNENVLKLKVDKLTKCMTREDKEIYNLQRYRLELETVMRERKIETDAAIDILMAKKKNLEEERGRLRADISIRNVRIEQFHNKYELASGLLGKDDSGSPMSMTQFKIQLAQEKFMLQQEGDDLDSKIRKAEGEIVAMENTLKVVNMTNTSFKSSLEAVEKEGKETQEAKELEFKVKDCGSELREKKRFYISRQDFLNELSEKLKQLDATIVEYKEDLHSKLDVHSKFEREEGDRQVKIQRADRQIVSCKKSISSTNLAKYDKDLYIRQLQDTNRNIMYQLASFSSENPETVPVLNRYMLIYQLEMPKLRTSMSTVSSDSVLSLSSVSTKQPSSRQNTMATASVLTSVDITLDAHLTVDAGKLRKKKM